jgi:hypothetical protein
LKLNFPFLEKVDETDFLFIDCREIGDPTHDKRLRDHVGVYPENLSNMVDQASCRAMWRATVANVETHLRREGKETMILVPLCKSGRHRRLANWKLLLAVLRALYPQINIETHHLSEGDGWKWTCKGVCPECKAETPELKAVVKRATDVAITLWQGKEPERPAARGSAARRSSRPPDGREVITIMQPQSKKRPETSRSKSVAPPIWGALTAKEKADLADRTAELKREAQQAKAQRGHDLSSLLADIPEDALLKQVISIVCRECTRFSPRLR